MLKPRKILEVGNSGLLLLVFVTIFIVPVFPLTWHNLAYPVLFTLIYLISATAVQTQRMNILLLAVSLAAINWASDMLGLVILDRISRYFTLIFFIIIVFKLIIQIATVKRVTAQVILEAINSYLLLGMAFAIIIGLIVEIDPQSLSFKTDIITDPAISNFSEIVYYGFVTMSTLGYGDIVPLTPVAKSVAILTAVGGQIYIAVILALLVGKYAGAVTNK